jgi:hypothetical protein
VPESVRDLSFRLHTPSKTHSESFISEYNATRFS